MSSSLKAQTVLGPVDIELLGVTLPHEHILADARKIFFFEPPDSSEKPLAQAPVTLENLYWIRAHALSNLDNLKMPEEPVLVAELLAYKQAGGSTIIDVSTRPLGGTDPAGLQRLSRSTGLNIIMGCGYYSGLRYYPEGDALTESQISEGMVRDLTEGVGGTGVRAGIIGEIGLTPALGEDERRLLCACARTQYQTGAPLTIHPPGLKADLMQEILGILRNNGGRLEKTVICHVDIMGLDLDIIRRIAEAGCYVEFDTFGHLFPPLITGSGLMNFPDDGQRIRAVKQLVDEGYQEHILLSQDTFLKVLLKTYGGFGYAHILRNILPALRRQGISEQQIQTLTVGNAGRLLAF
jgi:phosphotriesterase-related protein